MPRWLRSGERPLSGALAALAGLVAAGTLVTVSVLATPSEQLPSAETVERALIAAINRDRAQLGEAPLAANSVLRRVAQRLAEALERRGAFAPELLAIDALVRTLETEGYSPYRVVQGVILSDDPPVELATFWALANPQSYRSFLEGALDDLGVGVARVEGAPVYTVVAARSAATENARQAAALGDLGALRDAMLERVNRERQKEGLAPLRRRAQLERAAQSYAEQMLAEGFYGHVSPRGETVLERAQAAGYRLSRVGENVAHGQASVDAVMDDWMQSPPHRENILSPIFTDFGMGLAAGTGPEGFQILWVQVFGRPR